MRRCRARLPGCLSQAERALGGVTTLHTVVLEQTGARLAIRNVAIPSHF